MQLGGHLIMEDNLARELELDEQAVDWNQAYAQPVQQPYEQTAPTIEPIPQAAPLTKGLTKFELFLITSFAIIIFGMILLNVQSSLELSTASRNVQDVNAQITQANIEIENLQQQSHELTRYDRIQAIANKYGLELHEDNIINIVPQE